MKRGPKYHYMYVFCLGVLLDFLATRLNTQFGSRCAPPVVADEAKLAIVGPCVLACATRGGGRSEAGHCFYLIFLVQTCLRASPVVAEEAKLAIVLTYFFGPGGFECAT